MIYFKTNKNCDQRASENNKELNKTIYQHGDNANQAPIVKQCNQHEQHNPWTCINRKARKFA
jgi:hypothetical protein